MLLATMYDFHSRYLASSFLDAQSIAKLSAESHADLFTRYKDLDFLPMSLFEAVAGEGLKPRAGFYSASKGTQIAFTSTRFNVELKPEHPFSQLKLGSPLGDLSKFSEEAGSVLAEALAFFRRDCHRLALVQEGFLPVLSQEQMNEITNKLLRRPEIPKGAPFEWNWRIATKVERSFGDRDETTNTIITVRRVTLIKEEKEEDRIRFDIDINTNPDDVRARFGQKEAVAFFREAPRWHEALVAEMSTFLNLEQ